MIMETISYGYPMTPSGLAPLSPTITPTGAGEFAPQLYAPATYTQQAYSSNPIHPSRTFTPSKLDNEDAKNNNIFQDNFNSSDCRLPADSNLLDELTNLSLSDDGCFSDLSSVSEADYYGSRISESSSCSIGSPNDSGIGSLSSKSPTPPGTKQKGKKNSRSKAKASTDSTCSTTSMDSLDSSKSRKDSRVYDVRLPDEQVLLFVPDLDLVKSHLMFAVREEVDVLKDRIVDLMDRIKHLECENTYFRQYASPEVIQQLQTQISHQMPQPPHHSSTS